MSSNSITNATMATVRAAMNSLCSMIASSGLLSAVSEMKNNETKGLTKCSLLLLTKTKRKRVCFSMLGDCCDNDSVCATIVVVRIDFKL